MDLSRTFLRPGTVCQVVDTEGTVRAWSPGLFSLGDYDIINHAPKESDIWKEDRHAENEDILPPIIPFLMPGSSSFSSPKVDDLIWIMHDESNPQMFYYLKVNQLSPSVKNLLASGGEQEVVFSRDTSKGLYQLYFNEGTGIKFLKDGNYITITADGNIELSTENPGSSISLGPGGVCLGGTLQEADGIQTHVAKGEKVEEALDTIITLLQQMLVTCTATAPWLTALVPVLTPVIPKLQSQVAEITSGTVKVA